MLLLLLFVVLFGISDEESYLFLPSLITRILMEAGADADSVHEMGSPLYIACSRGHDEVVQLLLQAKYRVPQFAIGADGQRTALHGACSGGHLRPAQLLLRRFPQNVNVVETNGRTPLHLVCEEYQPSRILIQGRCEIIRMLMQRGASIHARDRAGNTPVLLAAMSGCIDLMQTCVDVGGNILDRNRNGRSPIDEARQRKDTNMMQRLNELQKKIPRSVVLASRFAGYKVTGASPEVVESGGGRRSPEEEKTSSSLMGFRAASSGLKKGRRAEEEERAAENHQAMLASGRSDLGAGVMMEEEDQSPDASELVVVMQSRPGSRC